MLLLCCCAAAAAWMPCARTRGGRAAASAARRRVSACFSTRSPPAPLPSPPCSAAPHVLIHAALPAGPPPQHEALAGRQGAGRARAFCPEALQWPTAGSPTWLPCCYPAAVCQAQGAGIHPHHCPAPHPHPTLLPPRPPPPRAAGPRAAGGPPLGGQGQGALDHSGHLRLPRRLQHPQPAGPGELAHGCQRSMGASAAWMAALHGWQPSAAPPPPRRAACCRGCSACPAPTLCPRPARSPCGQHGSSKSTTTAATAGTRAGAAWSRKTSSARSPLSARWAAVSAAPRAAPV